MKLSLAAAFSEDLVIGQNSDLPWHLPEDLKRFKRYTWKKWICIGRRTWESMGAVPLKGRETIVVSRTLRPSDVHGAHVATSYEGAIEIAAQNGAAELVACGGSEIYKAALPLISEAAVTVVRGKLSYGARFPKWQWLAFTMRSNVAVVDKLEDNGHHCSHELWVESHPSPADVH